jgi:hypothetical protein
MSSSESNKAADSVNTFNNESNEGDSSGGGGGTAITTTSAVSGETTTTTTLTAANESSSSANETSTEKSIYRNFLERISSRGYVNFGLSILIIEDDESATAAAAAIEFPVEELQRLDEMLNRTRWIVPVLPKSELECLLNASIRLCKLKLDTKSEHCQRFFRDGLTVSFVRVMTDDAVNTWKYDIYVRILWFICPKSM